MVSGRLIESIHQVSAAHWDELWDNQHGRRYPFIRHAFLAALEDSGCTSEDSGWEPQHLLLEEGGQLLGAMPLYRKHHSYGEYVFDWAWADAYHRNGLNYYPKLLSAIPFTPATGPRLAVANGADGQALLSYAGQLLTDICHQQGLSGWHCLFTPADQQVHWDSGNSLQRIGCQFHWHNRGYQNFDDFLASFNSRKRKAVRRERRQVAEYGVRLSRRVGADISERDWDDFYQFYHTTYLKRSGGSGYLNRAFFSALAAHMSDQLLMVQAHYQGDHIASALCFFDDSHLYGRYWGCVEEVPGLHFEACYYQGIEFAIERGLHTFDPGAQGEHKIQRGFEPTLTYSHHWLADSRFQAAVADFLERETPGVKAYQRECEAFLPFRASDN